MSAFYEAKICLRGETMQSYYESARDRIDQPHAWYSRENRCDPHFHSGIELVYMIQGRLSAVINGQTTPVQTGEMLITNCYSVHAYTPSDDCDSIVAVIPLSAVPSIQKRLTTNRFSKITIPDDENHSLEFLMRLFADGPAQPTFLKGISYAILGLLIDRVPLAPVGSTDQADVICKILNYLSENYTQRLTVEQVASRFGYSRSRFSHLFKTTVGYSLPQYLNMLRCRSVCDVLLSTDTPIVELATDAGFNSTHTFYTAFKACYHMTPREYIRAHGGEDKE